LRIYCGSRVVDPRKGTDPHFWSDGHIDKVKGKIMVGLECQRRKTSETINPTLFDSGTVNQSKITINLAS
jgi:hypothetical protein